VGNVEQMRHTAGALGNWTRYYSYAPDSNRLLRTWEGDNDWNSSNATNKTTYQYDAHGNMLNLANVAPGQFLRWDQRDMIASLDLVGGGDAYYQYDAGKQRTRKTLVRNGGKDVEERIYLGGLEIYRRTLNGVLKEEIETLHFTDGSLRVLMVDQILQTDNPALGKRDLYRYTLGNHLGSATLEVDESAGIISYEEYHPYGTTAYRAGRNAVEVRLKRYRYTGMERDEESGLSYHRARYMIPWLGRWTGVDPAGLGQGLNLYAYCSDSPTSNVDPTGFADKTVNQVGAANERKFREVLERLKNAFVEQLEIGNSRIDFDVAVDHTVDIKARRLEKWLNKGGDFKKGKMTEFELKNLAESVKHVRDTGKSETMLYVLQKATPEQLEEYRKFIKSIHSSEEGMKLLKELPEGTRIGLGVTTFDKLEKTAKPFADYILRRGGVEYFVKKGGGLVPRMGKEAATEAKLAKEAATAAKGFTAAETLDSVGAGGLNEKSAGDTEAVMSIPAVDALTGTKNKQADIIIRSLQGDTGTPEPKKQIRPMPVPKKEPGFLDWLFGDDEAEEAKKKQERLDKIKKDWEEKSKY
jgi:RHS repeat-associated protein